jgi:DNA-binding XRE family transcriptional regulator
MNGGDGPGGNLGAACFPLMCLYRTTMDQDEYRRMRIEAGLTQVELARRLGVTPITIQARENGRFKITDEAAIALRAVLRGSASSAAEPTPPPTTNRRGSKRQT